MTHLQMKQHLIILLLSGLAFHAIATTETICELIAQHRYKDIALQSITWDNYRESVLLFTAPKNRYYSLPIEKVTRTSMDLSEASPQNMEEKGEYKTALGLVDKASLRATYMFYIWKYTIVPIWSYKHIVLLATDRGVLTGNFKYDRTEEVTKPDGTALPDFSLASIGYYGPVLHGYVLYLDEPQWYLKLSQFQVNYLDSKVEGLPSAKGSNGTSQAGPHYYLHVYESPHRVYLVTSPDAEAQLFTPGGPVPRAFLDTAKNLVLFNSETGCVHIIHGLGDFSFPEGSSRSQEREHAFLRINLPYEVYFKCGKPLDNPNPHRCHVVKGAAHHRPNGQIDQTTENVDSFSGGRTVTVFLVVVVLAVGLIYTITIKIKSRKLARSGQVKSLASSSVAAVGGTSKSSNKRTTTSRSSFTGKSKTGYSSTGNSLTPGQSQRRLHSKLSKGRSAVKALGSYAVSRSGISKTGGTSKTGSMRTASRSSFAGKSKTGYSLISSPAQAKHVSRLSKTPTGSKTGASK